MAGSMVVTGDELARALTEVNAAFAADRARISALEEAAKPKTATKKAKKDTEEPFEVV